MLNSVQVSCKSKGFGCCGIALGFQRCFTVLPTQYHRWEEGAAEHVLGYFIYMACSYQSLRKNFRLILSTWATRQRLQFIRFLQNFRLSCSQFATLKAIILLVVVSMLILYYNSLFPLAVIILQILGFTKRIEIWIMRDSNSGYCGSRSPRCQLSYSLDRASGKRLMLYHYV